MSVFTPRPPDGIVAGLGRAGTTWIHRQLELETGAFTPSQKDIAFFDRHFDKGSSWYFNHFCDADTGQRVIDVSHDYFFHPLTPSRIRELCPDVLVLVVLRDPVTWGMSVARREAITRRWASVTAREAYHMNLGTLAAGLFSAYASNWRRVFGDQVTFLLYDDLQRDAASFWADVASALGFESHRCPTSEVVNDTRVARFGALYSLAAQVAAVLKTRGRGSMVGRVKRHPIVQRSLLTQRHFDGDVLTSEEFKEAKLFYRSDVAQLSEIVGMDLVDRWNY